MTMVNTLFQKMAYSIGGINTVIGYILIRQDNVKGDSIALVWLRN